MGVSCFIYFFTSRVSRKTLPGAKKKKKKEDPGQVWGDRELGPGCAAGLGIDIGAHGLHLRAFCMRLEEERPCSREQLGSSESSGRLQV